VRDVRLLLRQIYELTSSGITVEASDNYSTLCVRNLQLPFDGLWSGDRGLYTHSISILIDIPNNYPRCGKVIGTCHSTSAIHIPYLKCNGRKIKDLHECDHKPWYWLCFESLEWKEYRMT